MGYALDGGSVDLLYGNWDPDLDGFSDRLLIYHRWFDGEKEHSVLLMDGTKTTGPDGMPESFVRRSWIRGNAESRAPQKPDEKYGALQAEREIEATCQGSPVVENCLMAERLKLEVKKVSYRNTESNLVREAVNCMFGIR